MASDSFELFIHSYTRQIHELQGNVDRFQPERIRKAVEIIYACKGKVAVTGMGKSGLIAQKLSATFSSTGTPAFFLHPGESLHGDLGALQAGDVLLAIAKSGESEELISMLQAVRKMGNPIIAILGNPDSTAGRMASVIIRASVSREADPLNLAPTASTTVALVVGDSLAAALCELKQFKPENFAMFHPAGQLGRRLSLNVEDLLVTDQGLPVVTEEATMHEVLEAESRPNLGGVMVIDREGRLLGLITDGDIRRGILRHGNILGKHPTEIMTRDPLSIAAGTLALDALQLMEDRPSQISVLPVIDRENRPVGLLRLHDLVRAGLR